MFVVILAGANSDDLTPLVIDGIECEPVCPDAPLSPALQALDARNSAEHWRV